MVTSIGPVLPGSSAQAVEPTSDKTQRSIAEARRVLAQNHVSGAKAMRIVTMLTQAQQNMSSGKSVDAQRVAREALKLAQEEETSTETLPNPNAENTEENAPTAGGANGTDETPASDAMGINPDEPFQRQTTSYADASDDAGVSFQYAQPLTQGQAPFAVRLHEMSHVRRETSEAILNGQRVLASITVQSHIDPQTGQRQVGGGRARVIVFPDMKAPSLTGKNLNVKG